MKNEIYKRLFSHAPFGYSYQKIVFDKTGKAVGNIYLDVNAVFEKITGLKSKNILNRNSAEISPKSNIDDLKQIEQMIDTALNGKEYEYEYFSECTHKYYNVQVYSVEKGFFTRVFIEIPKEKNAGYTSTAQEDKYYRLIEFAVDAFFHVDREGRFITVNTSAEELTAYSRDELLKMNIVDLFPEDTLKNKPLRFDLLETGQTLITERDGRKKNGEIIPIEMHSKRMPDGSYQAFVRDITEAKLAQEALYEKTAELDRYFSLALDLLCIADTNGNFIRVNKEWENTLGYSVQELENRKFLEFVHPDDMQATLDAMTILNGQEQILNFVNRYRKKDGTYCWIEWRSHPIGNIIYAAARDITERIQSEEALKLERSQLLSIFDSIDEVIYVTDPYTYEVIFANRAMKKAFNRELIGGICYQEFQGLDAPCPFCTNEIILRQKPEPYCWEYHNPTVNMDYAIIDRIIKWTDGRDVRFELAIDITERKRVEKELIDAKEKAEESGRLKSAFLANLSHEIRTPMNAILGFTEILKFSELTIERKEHYLDVILKSGRQLLSIINDIIEMSKIDAGQMKLLYSPIDINSLLLDLYNEMKILIPYDKSVTLKIIEPKYNLKIISDEVKLNQILTNLITNAVKYTENGWIAFGCKEIHQDTGQLEFIVQDTGCGIDKKYHQVIFERFRQGDGDLIIIKGGSGLGLAISKSYVEMLGGTIGVESELGKGSLFTFTIPLEMAEHHPVQADEQEELLVIKPKKSSPILIAEDDEDNYYYIQEIMKLEDFPIIRAKNGQEAVDLCRTNENIRIVLMDIQMPVMDGYAALKEIRKIRPGLLIIAQTAFALSGDKEHILNAGFDGYITKPINVPELMKILNS